MKRERNGDTSTKADNDDKDESIPEIDLENPDALLAGINDMMNKCTAIHLAAGGSDEFGADEDNEEEDEEVEGETADDVMANIQALMEKCELIEKTARDMDDGSFWAAKAAERKSDEEFLEKDE